MDNPTHTDAFLNLLSSCFPSTCRPKRPALPPSPRLGALLRESESDDAMSLHSTYRPHTRPKKKKPAMQLCGVNLFGKPRGQIRLEDDDDDETQPPIPRSHPRPRYDSDAAPLPDSTIQSLSARSPTQEQPTRQETPEEELARLRAEKAARKARKRERKLKRQLALEHTTGEFEGFIGSGGDGFPISPPSTTTSTPGMEDLMSDRGSSARLVVVVDDHDADPEDAEADMGAAAYTRSTRSRSESGSSATRSSKARDELVPGNALGLRGPPSPLAQESIPENEVVGKRPEPVVQTEPQPLPEPEPTPKTPVLETQPARPKPKIHISNLPLSSPGAGPGPRTLEHSPRLANGYFSPQSQAQAQAQAQSNYDTDSPRLTIPRHLPSPRTGFPSSGLARTAGTGFPSTGLGKSYGSSAGLGLNVNVTSSGGERERSRSLVPDPNGPRSPLADSYGVQSVFDPARRGSGDASSQRSGWAGDGSRVDGGGQGRGQGNGGHESEWKGRVTPQMGVALANRGGE